MSRRSRVALKVVAWAACLAPLGWLLVRADSNDLSANPISFVTNWLGDWTLRILLASLAMTPLRILFGLSWPVTLRRLLGLFAFAYTTLHFSVWLVVDHFFDWPTMVADIVKRPYVTVGFTALVLLLPLAATSTTGMIRRVGATNWRRLHRLVGSVEPHRQGWFVGHRSISVFISAGLGRSRGRSAANGRGRPKAR